MKIPVVNHPARGQIQEWRRKAGVVLGCKGDGASKTRVFMKRRGARGPSRASDREDSKGVGTMERFQAGGQEVGERGDWGKQRPN